MMDNLAIIIALIFAFLALGLCIYVFREIRIMLKARKELGRDFKWWLAEFNLFWTYTSMEHNLSIEFIRKYQNKLNWKLVSKWSNLSKDMIEEFAHKVHWKNISRYQDLSEEFIREYHKKLDMNAVMGNRHKWSESFVREFRGYYFFYYPEKYLALCVLRGKYWGFNT